MADTYNSIANQWIIQSPNPKTAPITQGLKTCINDANLFTRKLATQTNNEFLAAAQQDTDLWHGIL